MVEKRLERHLGDLWREGIGKSSPVAFPACGGSMRPLIISGSTLYIERVDPEDVRLGDLVVFLSHGRLVTHRVIGFSTRGKRKAFRTKGDFLDHADELVDDHELVARVVAVERKGRIRRLDTRGWRLINGVAARLSPWSRWVVHPLKFIRRRAG